jgi:hypothetical protein
VVLRNLDEMYAGRRGFESEDAKACLPVERESCVLSHNPNGSAGSKASLVASLAQEVVHVIGKAEIKV